jgi:hypothetical protein
MALVEDEKVVAEEEMVVAVEATVAVVEREVVLQNRRQSPNLWWRHPLQHLLQHRRQLWKRLQKSQRINLTCWPLILTRIRRKQRRRSRNCNKQRVTVDRHVFSLSLARIFSRAVSSPTMKLFGSNTLFS